jgi:limonene-1,2-epoxide hydrolase
VYGSSPNRKQEVNDEKCSSHVARGGSVGDERARRRLRGGERQGRARVVDSWFKGDLDQTMSYLAEDVRWWNVPMEPIKGQAKSREFLAPFVQKDPLVVPFSFRTEVKQTLADGPNVVIERVDHFDINGKKWEIPVVGVFEVRNEKIAVWKDYFDMGQFQPVDTLIQSLAKKK